MAAVPANRRRSVLQYLADNNPFYLLSAACMLLACLLLSNTMTWSPIAFSRIAWLIVTISVYELLIVGLGLYLIAQRGLARDGVMLLALEAVFLADIGFLSSEAYQESLSAGLVANGALLAIGLVKLVAIFRVLRMPIASPVFGLVVTTLVVLLGHPALLRYLGNGDRGNVPEGAMYAIWWVVGGLIAAYAVALRNAVETLFRGTLTTTYAAGVGHIVMGVMLVSLVAHIGTAHWVYESPFRAADLSPLFIAAAMLMASVPAGAYVRRVDAMTLSVLLLLLGVCTSLNARQSLVLDMRIATITPMLLALVAAYLAFAYCFAQRHFLRLAVAGMAIGTLYAVGPTWASMQGGGERIYRAIANVLDRAIPRSRVAWGAISAIGAFVLLAAGAAVSLRRPEDHGTPSGDVPPAELPSGPSAITPVSPPPVQLAQ